ncbi:precorrin-6Y C5,15-methyltransferase (decarboxylating) subunit CbiT [Megamonas hypermegale]|uniref:precorrin-6Y C5,15-methyltransferase (decarboxylating) subunit CbiT n=1 Tax=Megamonas hypermegale TaxID=158847 RepID=UPI0025A3ED60|nr:precorrin-6Y C5,15-methyltransferase (decarboxylating) subunit CbiT [Megamonas hypermegale]MDM8142385.1 precorrin-6Y C5,15-methyltransferase (decarboxylating) subunit CbiT [Megamonas hypermegale]
MNLPGISDDLFIRDKVPMTKEEIRILTMCKAKIRPDSIIWDIGAGTGSLSIEAAMLAPQGRVYAVEKKDLAVELLQKNIAKFALQDKIEVIQANAPQGLENLPDCDVVFIGGSGSNMFAILDEIDTKLQTGGRIVVNAVTVQTIAQITEYMTQKENYTYEAVQVQVNRLRKVGAYDMFNAQNPVYIVTCVKGDKK